MFVAFALVLCALMYINMTNGLSTSGDMSKKESGPTIIRKVPDIVDTWFDADFINFLKELQFDWTKLKPETLIDMYHASITVNNFKLK
jgi:hypothetical protein